MEIPNTPDLILYAIPIFATTVIIEGIIISRKKPGSYLVKDAATSLTMGLGNVAIGFISKLMVAFVVLPHSHLHGGPGYSFSLQMISAITGRIG